MTKATTYRGYIIEFLHDLPCKHWGYEPVDFLGPEDVRPTGISRSE